MRRTPDAGPYRPGSGPRRSVSQTPSTPASASAETVTVTCGSSPPTVGRSGRSSHWRQTSPSASARRCAGVRSSMSPFDRARVSASTIARSAVRTVSPVSGSSVPSTRTMPCIVTDACRRRCARSASSLSTPRSRSTACRQYATTRPRSPTEWMLAASTSCDSASANAVGSASRAATRPLAEHIEISAASTATRVTGISSRARAVRTWSRATPHDILNALASHAAAERWPSRRNRPRRSISANRRSASSSSRSTMPRISAKSSSRRASGSSKSVSLRSDSTADRSSLTSATHRTCVRL